jgi:hypothetical protein
MTRLLLILPWAALMCLYVSLAIMTIGKAVPRSLADLAMDLDNRVFR